jgi:Na+/H+-dicarboxylate symporter
VRPLLVGLAAGTTVGLFFGERAGVLQSIADGFVKLLQMAVLPYVTVSIIGSIGALRVDDLRTLGGRAALALAALWALALGCAFLMPLTFPHVQSGRFFSTTLVERPPPFDFVDLYIPANPFFALANNVVPAVVLFSIVVGVALIGVPRRQALLDVLDVAASALSRAMRFVVRLTPYGIFAIAATTAATLRIDQAGRLQIYLLAYGAFALLLTLWMLPGLVSALTPIPARALLAETREALITAAVAGDLFIVLPVLVAGCKALIARHATSRTEGQTVPDVIVPVSYNFPHSGKLLSMSFVLFAAWFSDTLVAPSEYPRLAAVGLVTLFGSVTSAVPYLLDFLHVPSDTFQLFVASGIINSRFGALVAAMHTVAVTLIGTCAVTGAVRLRVVPLARYAATTCAVTAAVVLGVRALGAAIAPVPVTGDALAQMYVQRRAESVVVHQTFDMGEEPSAARSGERLHEIAATRRLRVCYLSDALPFAFFNGRQELVGYDVALVHRLALELDARLELTSVPRSAVDDPAGITTLLDAGWCDLVIGGLAVTTQRAGSMQLSAPYFDETVGFVVPDEARRRFESWDAIRARGALTIAVPDVPYYIDKLRDRLPGARLWKAATMDDLFRMHGVDAIAIPAERGSAWTLRYPQYSVVVPLPNPIRVPLALAMPRGETELTAFVNTWLDLKKRDDTLDELYRYWILGRDPQPPRPRWSIVHDVLHWMN